MLSLPLYFSKIQARIFSKCVNLVHTHKTARSPAAVLQTVRFNSEMYVFVILQNVNTA